MDWGDPEHRLALVRLLEEGRLVRSGRTEPVADYLLELGWAAQTGRRREIELSVPGEREVRRLLARVWPAWEVSVKALQRSGLPLSAKALANYRRGGILEGLWERLPRRLHRKTFAAIAGEHSKASVSEDLRTRAPDLELTGDDVLRVRCNRGLQLVGNDGKRLHCDPVMDCLGEIALPERAFGESLRLGGALPGAVMTVENLGAYVDLPAPASLLVIHQPGWNCALSVRFLACLPVTIPVHHFGDLDPEGLQIYEHLRTTSGRDIRLFVPACWGGYLHSHGRVLENPWPSEQTLNVSIGLLDELMVTQSWLEQEVVLADPGLVGELEALVVS